MAKLIYCRNYAEFQEYLVKNNKLGDPSYEYLQYPMNIKDGDEIIPYGNYRTRADMGQAAEICLRKGIRFAI